MIHRVGTNATIRHDRENKCWVGAADYEGEKYTFTSVELAQVVFELSDIGAIDPESYEWTNNNGVEQVLVVVPEGGGE